MPRTLSDQEYNYYENRRQVADFVESIYNDPSLAKEAKRLIKKKYPQIQIPDLDIEDSVDTRIKDLKKERDDEERAKKQKETEENLKKERTRVQKEYSFTDEAMKDLDKLMLDRGVDDYDVAATYLASKNPKPSEPTTGNGSRFWRHDQQQGFAEIAKDPEKWAEKELLDAMRRDEASANKWR